MNDFIVVFVNEKQEVVTVFQGTEGKCKAYFNKQSAAGMPTHHLYIVKNNEKSMNRFKRGKNLPLT